MYKAIEKYKCSCGWWESFGLPYQHIVCIMVQENVEELPESYISKCWTKDCKQTKQAIKVAVENSEAMYKLCFGALIQRYCWLCSLAARLVDEFQVV